MNQPDAGIELLREHYVDPVALERRTDGIVCAAALPDGTPVTALALAPDVSRGVRDPAAYVRAFEHAAAVRHEGLARPLAWGRLAGGTLHAAWERSDGRVMEPGTLPPSEVARIGIQAARALQTAHDAGILHGAVATHRLVRAEAGVLLLEFGLYHALLAGGASARDVALALSDTPFVSPETQAGQAPDERSDVFALGAALYELLTGKAPYGGRTTSFVMATVLTPDSHSDTAADAPSPVVDALLRAIEHAPDDRWPSAAAFAQALAAGDARRAGVNARAGCLSRPAAVVASLLATGVLSGFLRP